MSVPNIINVGREKNSPPPGELTTVVADQGYLPYSYSPTVVWDTMRKKRETEKLRKKKTMVKQKKISLVLRILRLQIYKALRIAPDLPMFKKKSF